LARDFLVRLLAR
jgi:hypothetical protein